MPHIVHKVRRPDPNVVAGLGKLGTATIHEAQGQIVMLPRTIRPIYPGMKCCGPACTVQSEGGDNLMLQISITMAEPGDVITHDGEDWLDSYIWGEVLTTAAIARGVAGFVTSGAVRKTEPIPLKGLPVFARGVSTKWSPLSSLGTINHLINLGGIAIQPGDIIAGDDDGLVVIPLDRAAQVLDNALAHERKKREMMAPLQAVTSTLE